MKKCLSLVVACIMILAMMLPAYAEDIVIEDITPDDISAVEIVSDEQIAADEIQADTIDDTANEAVTTDEIGIENNLNAPIYRYTMSFDDSACPGASLDVASVGSIANGVRASKSEYSLFKCHCGAWYDKYDLLKQHVDTLNPFLHGGAEWIYGGTYHAKISASNPLIFSGYHEGIAVIISRPEGYVVEYSTDSGVTFHRSFWLNPGNPDETTLNDEPATAISILGESLPTNQVIIRLKKIVTSEDTEKIGNFVERLYTTALGRASEAKGKKAWTDYLVEGRMTGAEAAKQFMICKEFTNRNLSNDEFLNVVYQTFFGRAPDESGYNAWMNFLENGFSREGVICQFAVSKEFQEICDNYGMVRGEIKSTQPRDKNATLTAFVNRIYTKLLDRNAEEKGLNDWTGAISKGDFTVKQTAVIFVESKEFLGHNYSTEDFVTHLYRMFFGREPEAAGFKTWVDYINAGKITRTGAAEAFADSKEFAAIMKDAGISDEASKPHEHNWVTKTTHHNAVGHYEPFYEAHKIVVCGCGRVFDDYSAWTEHTDLGYTGGCRLKPTTQDKTMEAGSHFIEDTAAWDETYQECSICGTIK